MHELEDIIDTLDDEEIMTTYQYRLFQCLLEKDCVLFNADLGIQSTDNTALQTLSAKILDSLSSAGQVSKAMKEENSAARSYRSAEKLVRNFVTSQHKREEASVYISLMLLKALYEERGNIATDLAKTDEGRFKAYNIWGTMHAHSLTNAYKKAGMLVANPILLGDTEATQFLPGHDLTPQERDIYLKRQIIASAISKAVLDNEFARTDRTVSLVRPILADLVIDTESQHPIHVYAQLFSLYRSIEQNYDASYDGETEDVRSEAYHRMLVDTHTLHNLLGELGIDASRFLQDPLVETA